MSAYILAGLIGVLLTGSIAASQTKAAPETKPQQVSLPAARQRGAMSLEETLARRRSVREFSPKALTQQQLGQLFWAAQGITDSEGRRTAPSAGAKYPLELYVATAEGFFHYLPKGHQLERVSDRDLRPALAEAALGQESVAKAAAVFVFTAEYARTAQKYGERTPRYVAIEVGHAGQNLLLEATALGLVGVPVGAFQDARVAKVLNLPAQYEPLYLIPVGYPRQ